MVLEAYMGSNTKSRDLYVLVRFYQKEELSQQKFPIIPELIDSEETVQLFGEIKQIMALLNSASSSSEEEKIVERHWKRQSSQKDRLEKVPWREPIVF